ncbi:MAG: hypothetical protein VKP72_00150 [bacterium]|nr:hypothetical protein [bacterium]
MSEHEISMREAGRRGGNRVRERYGTEHFARIGAIGGQHGGRKGGLATAARHGRSHFQEIGRRGAERLRELVARGQAAELASPEHQV